MTTTPRCSGALRRAAVLLPMLLAAGCASTRAVPGDDGTTRLRVLVYNIHAGKDAHGIDNLARVATVVRAAAADIVLLQEVDRGTRRSGGVDQVAELSRLTGMHAAFGNTLDYDGGKYGIALLSRWPIARDTLVRLKVEPPQERAGGSYEPRGALRAEIASPYGALTVVNTHLDPSGSDRWRSQEVRGVLALVDQASSGGRAIVLVGGDFNSTPGSSTHAAMTDDGWHDAWMVCGDGAGLTYPADSAVKRIDYLYFSGGVRCASARVPETTASDHRPLQVELLLPGGH